MPPPCPPGGNAPDSPRPDRFRPDSVKACKSATDCDRLRAFASTRVRSRAFSDVGVVEIDSSGPAPKALQALRRPSGRPRGPTRCSGGLQDGPEALQALRRPSGRPERRFPADRPKTGAVESPPTDERHLPRGGGRGKTGVLARRIGSAHVVRRRETFGRALFRRLAGPPAEYKSRCEPGGQSVRAHPANKRGFRPSGVSLQRPGLAGPDRDRERLPPEWSKPG